MTLKEVRDSALSLPRRSREKLLQDLTQSLGDGISHGPSEGLSENDPSFSKILHERKAAYDRGEDKGVSWPEVRESLKAHAHGRKILKRRQA
jgi:hypothetical protein